MGWRELADAGCDLYEIPGTNETAYKEPQVRDFARRLHACLDEVARSAAPDGWPQTIPGRRMTPPPDGEVAWSTSPPTERDRRPGAAAR
jgi:hypothetical protein